MVNKPNRKVKKHTEHVPLKAVADVRVPKQRELVEAIVKENNGKYSSFILSKAGFSTGSGANNRKRTGGRLIQTIRVPDDKTKTITYGETTTHTFPHPSRGKLLQIRHRNQINNQI